MLADSEVQAVACRFDGEDFANSIAMSSKEEKDKAIKKLGVANLSVRQIERLTKIGHGIIQGCRPET